MAETDKTLRALPHALGPEKALLSAFFNDPVNRIPEAVEAGLSACDFYVPSHATVFGTLLELHEAGAEIELVSFMQRLLDRGALDRVGGPAVLADLHTYNPAGLNFKKHLEMVREKRILRDLISTSSDTINRCYDEPEGAREILDATEAAVMAIREGTGTKTQTDTRDGVRAVMAELERILHGETTGAGLSSGFQGIDSITGGMKPGEMFVVAARPSMGKTALALNIVEAVAVEGGKPALVFSCEMSRHALLKRMIYGRAGVDIVKVGPGFSPSKTELERIHRAGMEIAKAPLHIRDSAGISIGELRGYARRIHRKAPLALIALDYLQLAKSTSKQAVTNREREIADISAGLKGLAVDLSVPVLVLAQLNRAPETRTGKNAGIPRLSDLRESGAIEQDADIVGLLYRSAYYASTPEEREAEAGNAELIVAKNRNGATGNVPLTFIAELTRFRDGAPVREPSPPPKQRTRFDHD